MSVRLFLGLDGSNGGNSPRLFLLMSSSPPCSSQVSWVTGVGRSSVDRSSLRMLWLYLDGSYFMDRTLLPFWHRSCRTGRTRPNLLTTQSWNQSTQRTVNTSILTHDAGCPITINSPIVAGAFIYLNSRKNKMINCFGSTRSHRHTNTTWWDLVSRYFGTRNRSLHGEVVHTGTAQGVQHLLSCVFSCRLLEMLLSCRLSLLSQSDTQKPQTHHPLQSGRIYDDRLLVFGSGRWNIFYFIYSLLLWRDTFLSGITGIWIWRVCFNIFKADSYLLLVV